MLCGNVKVPSDYPSLIVVVLARLARGTGGEVPVFRKPHGSRFRHRVPLSWQ